MAEVPEVRFGTVGDDGEITWHDVPDGRTVPEHIHDILGRLDELERPQVKLTLQDDRVNAIITVLVDEVLRLRQLLDTALQAGGDR